MGLSVTLSNAVNTDPRDNVTIVPLLVATIPTTPREVVTSYLLGRLSTTGGSELDPAAFGNLISHSFSLLVTVSTSLRMNKVLVLIHTA